MVAAREPVPVLTEDAIAELAAAAYRVALRHGLRAPFIEVELDLWRALRAVAAGRAEAADRPEVVPCPR
jgi:hypothetical protein